MYNKEELIDGLKGLLELIPNDVSPKSVEKREKLKKQLKKIEDKNKEIKQQDEIGITRG